MASNEKGDGAHCSLTEPLKTVDPELHEIILKEKVRWAGVIPGPPPQKKGANFQCASFPK